MSHEIGPLSPKIESLSCSIGSTAHACFIVAMSHSKFTFCEIKMDDIYGDLVLQQRVLSE